MKVFDERGKLFGVINILDLFLIIVLLGAIAFAGIKYFTPGDTAAGPGAAKAPVTYVLFNSNSHGFVVDKINVGDTLRDVGSNVVLGTIVDIEVGEAKHVVTTADGRMVQTTVPDKKQLYVTMESEATMAGEVAVIGGTQLLVGTSLQAKGPEYVLPFLISDVRIGE